jgi:hypothetical protein
MGVCGGRSPVLSINIGQAAVRKVDGCTRRTEHVLYSVMSARLSHNSVRLLPFLIEETGLNPRMVCMGFLVNKVELAQVCF